jgi:hypothetical protein
MEWLNMEGIGNKKGCLHEQPKSVQSSDGEVPNSIRPDRQNFGSSCKRRFNAKKEIRFTF